MIPETRKVDEEAQENAREHLDSLIKPKDSLGRLEQLCVKIAGIQAREPQIESKTLFLLAADHGIVEEEVSAYPSSVTAQMMRNFVEGGAAINTLSEEANVELKPVDIGVKEDVDLDGVIDEKIDYGTQNFHKENAISREQAKKSIKTGKILVEKYAPDSDVICLGEMGIGNTSSSAAILCSLYNFDPSEIVGAGTGIDSERLERKKKIIRESLERRDISENPLDILEKVGGFEIGGLTGIILEAAARRKLVIVDGYITIAAAALAIEIEPKTKDYLLFSHKPGEKGSDKIIEKLDIKPILDLNMKLGEGSGAVLAANIVDSAVKTYNSMATFQEVDL